MRFEAEDQTVPYGYCHCGCGERTAIARRNRHDKGHVRGEPVAYVLGHNARRTPDAFEVADAGYETPCWLWKRYINRDGYGRINAAGTVRLAHRVFYERVKGPIPEGLTLDHLCRVKHCVNPDHLEAVTLTENLHRAMRRLTPEQVQHIRNAPPRSGGRLARQYSTTYSTISLIRTRKTYT